MTIGKVCTWVCVTILAAVSAISTFGQDNKQGNIAAIEFQKIKPGMASQYEAGRKQKAAWHKSQNDTQPLLVWEVMSGDDTGMYVVGRLGLHWADLDKPSVPDQADLDEFNKVMGNYVESLVTRYYEFLPKVSMPGPDMNTRSKFSEIITFHVRYGHSDEFRTALDRVTEGAKKTNWGVNYTWLVLADGGKTGTYVLIEDHPNWADFEDKPGQKPFAGMLTEAFGRAEAESIIHQLDSSIESEETEIDQFRPDLSYMPGK